MSTQWPLELPSERAVAVHWNTVRELAKRRHEETGQEFAAAWKWAMDAAHDEELVRSELYRPGEDWPDLSPEPRRPWRGRRPQRDDSYTAVMEHLDRASWNGEA